MEKKLVGVKGILKKGIVAIVIASILMGIFVFLDIFFILRGKTIHISNVAQKKVITLSSGMQYPDGIHILITGNIDGMASIYKLYNEKKENIRYKVEKGKVHLCLTSEWYEDECVIIYEPVDVKSGALQIRYRFSNNHENLKLIKIYIILVSIIFISIFITRPKIKEQFQ
ncbi:MAG: hypothetical protein Q8O13_04700 [Candidatus Omnitrophota bacterium]|nr:hypothetical protein [Candidatus Omnitrophota bacterium]